MSTFMSIRQGKPRGFASLFIIKVRDDEVFSCSETVGHWVFPFSDTEIFLFQILRFLLVRNCRKLMFPFFGHHWKPMFFLFRKPRCLLQRTPLDTEFFLFQTNVLIYSGAWACYPQVPIWLTAKAMANTMGTKSPSGAHVGLSRMQMNC